MKTIKSKVKDVLTSYANTRDNNQELYRMYLTLHTKMSVANYYYEIANAIVKSEIPSQATIERFSRIVQLEESSLRGENWEYRKHIQSKIVQKDLGYTVKN